MTNVLNNSLFLVERNKLLSIIHSIIQISSKFRFGLYIVIIISIFYARSVKRIHCRYRQITQKNWNTIFIINNMYHKQKAQLRTLQTLTFYYPLKLPRVNWYFRTPDEVAPPAVLSQRRREYLMVLVFSPSLSSHYLHHKSERIFKYSVFAFKTLPKYYLFLI